LQRGFGDYSAYLWVAEGQGEIALPPTTVKAWDVAAIKVIVEESPAGGSPTSNGARRGIYGNHRVRQQRAACTTRRWAAMHGRP